MGQAGQGDHHVDLDTVIKVDQVDQGDLVNLVNPGPSSTWATVAKWTWTP